MIGGGCFGHSAFETEEKQPPRRKETARALDGTSVAVLNREDFVRVLRKFEKKESENIVGFMKKIPFFQKFSLNQIKKLMHHSEERAVTRNQYVYQ